MVRLFLIAGVVLCGSCAGSIKEKEELKQAVKEAKTATSVKVEKIKKVVLPVKPYEILSVKADPLSVKKGESTNVVLNYRVEKGWQLKAVTVFAYVKNTPPETKQVWKVKNPKKSPKWQNYLIKPWQWQKTLPAKQAARGTVNVSLITKEWPEGDYLLTCNTLFRYGKREKYVTKNFDLTVLP